MDAAAELGRNPVVSKHQIQPEYGDDEQADAGRDCEPVCETFSGANVDKGNINFPCSADHEQDWQPYPIDPLFCYIYV